MFLTVLLLVLNPSHKLLQVSYGHSFLLVSLVFVTHIAHLIQMCHRFQAAWAYRILSLTYDACLRLSSIISLLFFVRPQTIQLWGRLALMPPRQTHPQSEPNTGSIHSPLDPDMIQNLNPYHGKWTVLSVTSAFFKADWGTCLCNPSCKAQRFHQRLTFPLQQYLSISPTGLFFMALQRAWSCLYCHSLLMEPSVSDHFSIADVWRVSC